MAEGTRHWVWVSLPHATYGIAHEFGRVVEAAPIAHWMVGKSTVYVSRWLTGKNAHVVHLGVVD